MYFKNPLAFIIPFLCITSFCSCTSTPQKYPKIDYDIIASGYKVVGVAVNEGKNSVVKSEAIGEGSFSGAFNTANNAEVTVKSLSDKSDSPQNNKKRNGENFSKVSKDVLPEFIGADEYVIGIGSCENGTHMISKEECSCIARMKARVDAIGKLTKNLSLESNFESLRDTRRESYSNNNVKDTMDIDEESYRRATTVKSDGKIPKGFIFRDVGWMDSNQFEVRAIAPDLSEIPTKNIYIFGYGKSKEESEIDALWQAGTFLGCISFNQYINIAMGINKYNETLATIKKYLAKTQEDTKIQFSNSSPRLFFSDKTQVKEYDKMSFDANPVYERNKWKISDDDLETLGMKGAETEYKVLFIFPIKKLQEAIDLIAHK